MNSNRSTWERSVRMSVPSPHGSEHHLEEPQNPHHHVASQAIEVERVTGVLAKRPRKPAPEPAPATNGGLEIPPYDDAAGGG